MVVIKVKELFLSILLRGALGTGRRALLLLKQRAIQYKTNICCYFSKLKSDVAAGFFFFFFFFKVLQEKRGIKGKSLKTKLFSLHRSCPESGPVDKYRGVKRKQENPLTCFN